MAVEILARGLDRVDAVDELGGDAIDLGGRGGEPLRGIGDPRQRAARRRYRLGDAIAPQPIGNRAVDVEAVENLARIDTRRDDDGAARADELENGRHTSELQSLMSI